MQCKSFSEPVNALYCLIPRSFLGSRIVFSLYLSPAVDLSEIIEPSEVLVAGNVFICGAMVRHLSSAGGKDERMKGVREGGRERRIASHLWTSRSIFKLSLCFIAMHVNQWLGV